MTTPEAKRQEERERLAKMVDSKAAQVEYCLTLTPWCDPDGVVAASVADGIRNMRSQAADWRAVASLIRGSGDLRAVNEYCDRVGALISVCNAAGRNDLVDDAYRAEAEMIAALRSSDVEQMVREICDALLRHDDYYAERVRRILNRSQPSSEPVGTQEMEHVTTIEVDGAKWWRVTCSCGWRDPRGFRPESRARQEAAQHRRAADRGTSLGDSDGL